MHPYQTNGEYFAQYLLDHHLNGRDARVWRDLGEALLASDRAGEWIAAVKEMTCLQLARRLIVAGSALLTRFDLPAAEPEIKQMIIETMVIDWSSAGDVYERLFPAVRSSRESIRNSVRREVTAVAKREIPYCYLCGVDLAFGGDTHLSLTLDHVWPRAYGGNSDIENLLGACKSCNVAKGDSASWAMYPIQSLVAGFESYDPEELPKAMRMSVQARAAVERANRKGLSLRDSFISLGRPGWPLVASGSTAVDVFNLQFVNR